MAAIGAMIAMTREPKKPPVPSSSPSAGAKHGTPLEHVAEHGNCAGKGGGNGPNQDVTVLHMGQFVGHDTLQFVRGEDAQNALGGSYSGMFGALPVAKALGDSSGMM